MGPLCFKAQLNPLESIFLNTAEIYGPPVEITGIAVQSNCLLL